MLVFRRTKWPICKIIFVEMQKQKVTLMFVVTEPPRKRDERRRAIQPEASVCCHDGSFLNLIYWWPFRKTGPFYLFVLWADITKDRSCYHSVFRANTERPSGVPTLRVTSWRHGVCDVGGLKTTNAQRFSGFWFGCFVFLSRRAKRNKRLLFLLLFFILILSISIFLVGVFVFHAEREWFWF